MLSQYQPLFLKYRPQAIAELVGQPQVAITLANAIKYKRISHAYLFTGPRGTGKTSAARIFAKSLNCEHGPTADPCQKCTSCLEIKQGISPSVFEIDAASNNSVDDARLLIERAPLSACGGRFKLYIIDECHMLTKEAFNALLKTIEEPPANVIFILATTEEHKVLPTIVSRCQKLIFRLIDEPAMMAHLSQVADKENIVIELEALTALMKRANGGLRDALSLLDQVSLLGVDGQAISTQDVLLLTGALPEDVLIALSNHIFKQEGEKVLSLLHELFASGREAHLIASELAKHMLNVAKAAYWNQDGIGSAGEAQFAQGAANNAGSQTYKKALVDLAKLIDQAELIQMIEEIDRLEISCRRSGQPIMNLEIGLLSLCQRLDIGQWKSINSRLHKLENAAGMNKDMPSLEQTSYPKHASEQKQTNEAKQASAAEETSAVRQNSKAKQATTQVKVEETTKLVLSSLPIDSLPVESPSVESLSVDSSLTKVISEDLTAISKKPKEETGPEIDKNIDIIWQNLLTELQRRHLPTYSLVSTHAFPIEISTDALTIGVFVENFQKMIENKVEHIKAAAIACNLRKDISVRIKVEPSGQSPSISAEKNDNFEDSEESIIPSAPAASNRGTNGQASASRLSARSVTKEEREAETAVREAYKLFEGPGSRYIAPSQ